MPNSIPMSYVTNYTLAVNKLKDQAKAEIEPKLRKIDLADIAIARDAIISLLDIYLSAYTDAAANIAANFYALCRNRILGGGYEPIVDSGRNPDATSGAIRAFMQTIVDGKPADVLYALVLDRVDYEITKAAADCTFINAENDPY